MIRFSDVCVAAGRKSREYFIKKGASLDKIFIAPDTTLYYPIKKKDNPPELKNKKVILYLSRIVRYKGLDYLIKAFSKLEKEDKNTFLLIAGNGDYAEEMKELAKKLNIKNIKFIGVVDKEHIGYYYNLCDVFVLPNRETESNDQLNGDYEGFGVVFLEASACGKPVIAGKSGGSCEAVVNGVTGLVVDPRSEDDIAHAIERILEDKSFAGRLGMAGRNRAEKEFDWQHIAKTMESIL